jgi:hypothetical protein
MALGWNATLKTCGHEIRGAGHVPMWEMSAADRFTLDHSNKKMKNRC